MLSMLGSASDEGSLRLGQLGERALAHFAASQIMPVQPS